MDTPSSPLLPQAADRGIRSRPIALTVLACLGTTAIATPLLGTLDLANIVMLFLLTVLLVAVKFGRNEAILASVLSVLLFDLFFVPPRFSLAVSDIQYLITFAVMLVTALVTAHLAAGLKLRAHESQRREQQTQALYQFARQLAGTRSIDEVVDIAQTVIRTQFNADSVLLLIDDARQLPPPSGPFTTMIEMHLARLAIESGERVRNNEISSMGYAPLYLPLRAAAEVRGVLAVRLNDNSPDRLSEITPLLETLASLIAVAVERLHYVERAQANEVRILTERLRSSILSAISHDLRTPLTAMVGLADSLFLIKPALPATALETAQALHEQADRLAGMVGNLLDMARLNAGEITLRREWQPIEEVIGAAIGLLGNALAAHPVKVSLPRDLPLLEFDAVLIERVLCNLIENAAKYSPAGSTIDIGAQEYADAVEISVEDNGPGFPQENTDALFGMFVRGKAESGAPGTGLGLAISRTIVEAHGGRIGAGNRVAGGGRVSFTLPKGTPPLLEDEPA